MLHAGAKRSEDSRMAKSPDLPAFSRSFLTVPRTGRPVCRLGLATRGQTSLTVNDIHGALDHGINFLNWCGTPNSLSQTIAALGSRRSEVGVCVQFEARTAAEAKAELSQILRELRTDYVDVLTFYYVEERADWQQLISQAGALELCQEAKRQGQVRLLGLTSHQRLLAAEAVRSG